MIKKLLVVALLCLPLTACGYDGFYRYPCQDPKNWETPECKPPICSAAGACPVDLVKTPEPEQPEGETTNE